MALPTLSGRAFLMKREGFEIRTVGNGTLMATAGLAFNKRKFNEESQEWEDVGKIVVNAVAFGDLAQFVADFVQGQTEFEVSGELEESEYTDKEGNTRTSLRLTLRTAGASIPKRDKGGNGGGGNGGRSGGNRRQNKPQENDPWASV
ncbi:single-stranded DNA-binding protein [Rhodococcus hoagii]|nr:single-stranded DNA-binding protein [Prescottella equi]